MDTQKRLAQPAVRRNTRQRQLVLDAVRARCDHPTAEDIYLDIQTVDAHVSRGTVYRNLNILAEDGLIVTVQTPGATRFDRRCDGHGHVICRTCGAVADIPLPYDEALDRQASKLSGFTVESHDIVFKGTCPSCLDAQDGAIADAGEGGVGERRGDMPVTAR